MNPARLEHDWYSRPLPANVQIGEQSWLYSSYAFAHYKSKASIGLRVGSNTGLYHGTFFDLGPEAEVEIGDYCSLVGVIFATNGRVIVGDYTFVAHEVVIADSSWQLPGENAIRSRPSIEIGRNVWIGAQAILVGNLSIGEGAIIGAGTFVTHDVPTYSVAAGNPMRILRTLSARQRNSQAENN
jgi:acetyltransferase-like isoleucine patch superfamily enzyme